MAAFVPSGVGLGGRARSSFVDSRVRLGDGKRRIGARVRMGLESADFSAMGDHIVRFHDSLVASTILYVIPTGYDFAGFGLATRVG
mmetsp:Transcript_43147/g.168960  ORF Transcript_43147/g.168960 Transcript_43147/m.168960 type:complete len:86 (+) Transcript_43147:177-434(+)